MALQTKEGALHIPTWAGPGRVPRVREVGVSGGALQEEELCKQKFCHRKRLVRSGNSEGSKVTRRLYGREARPNGQRT